MDLIVSFSKRLIIFILTIDQESGETGLCYNQLLEANDKITQGVLKRKYFSTEDFLAIECNHLLEVGLSSCLHIHSDSTEI